ncbi:MAG: hypothetical protein BAA01_03510 [Bacillus thermozeamaize]|uniref:Uncharacterized protein n=1 Tax=Bacillus thermozeamaize TaxID=230954 RepID=A0A1Y3PHB1_9BACI|nr:MAG: hypothetical protein BAA01_03510 [Bacillus thermozeamaize]
MGEIPNLLDQLRAHFENTGGGDRTLLDVSPASLKPLWRWYLEVALAWLPRPREEFEEKYNRASGYLRRKMLTDPIHQMVLSPESKSLAMDIGIYFGEVFVRNHAGVEWVLNRKRRFTDTHHPVLSGFGKNSFFNPIEQVRGLVHGTLHQKQKNPDGLYAHYERYCQYLSR